MEHNSEVEQLRAANARLLEALIVCGDALVQIIGWHRLTLPALVRINAALASDARTP